MPVESVILLVLIIWAMILLVAVLVLYLRARYIDKQARKEGRPTYEFGQSISDWEQACAKSYDWSQSRRNNSSKKKEVEH